MNHKTNKGYTKKSLMIYKIKLKVLIYSLIRIIIEEWIISIRDKASLNWKWIIELIEFE